MTKKQNTAVILTASNQRTINDIPVFMCEIGSMPIVSHVIKNMAAISPRVIIVTVATEVIDKKYVDHIKSFLSQTESALVEFIALSGSNIQCNEEMSAVLFKMDNNADDLIISNADMPFLKSSSIEKMFESLNNAADSSILPAAVLPGMKYGNGLSEEIMSSINSDVFRGAKDDGYKSLIFYQPYAIAIHCLLLKKIFHEIPINNTHNNENNKERGAIYQIISATNTKGLPICYVEIEEEDMSIITTPHDLPVTEEIFQRKMRDSLISKGVKMTAPETVFFTATTDISKNVTIHPYVIFGNNVTVEAGVEIKSFSHIEKAYLEKNSTIGPFARIRANVHLESNVSIGNFVELKTDIIKKNTKINHISYIGDTMIGENTNIGAGTITCNYDGFTKHNTTIGNKCFVGSNTAIIAPINIGDNAIIAAGSVITEDVPAESLAISRIKQKNKIGKAKQIRKKLDSRSGAKHDT